jgi:hypothetical protein
VKKPEWVATNLVKQIVKRIREVPELEIAWLILKRTRGDALSALREDLVRMLASAITAVQADERGEDGRRLDWLQEIMRPDARYCEVYFAGLRCWTGEASAYQIEANPELFPTTAKPTVRECIDAAMRAEGELRKEQA